MPVFKPKLTKAQRQAELETYVAKCKAWLVAKLQAHPNRVELWEYLVANNYLMFPEEPLSAVPASKWFPDLDPELSVDENRAYTKAGYDQFMAGFNQYLSCLSSK